jgi:hypothetical protein
LQTNGTQQGINQTWHQPFQLVHIKFSGGYVNLVTNGVHPQAIELQKGVDAQCVPDSRLLLALAIWQQLTQI